MIPIPFIKFIPKIFQDDPLAIAMADKIDEHLQEWKDDVLSIRRFNRPDECPSSMIEELGTLLSAGLKSSDSDYQKRKKVATAIESHKNRGTFDFDVKLKIDAITGYSPGARLVDIYETSRWVLVDDLTEAVANYYASLGKDGVDSDLGILLEGDSGKGHVYIDCHEGVTTAVLTADDIESIKLDLEDSVPVYFYVYLGYINSSGLFTTYTDGVMG